MNHLVGDRRLRFPADAEARSARVVLPTGSVASKITVTEDSREKRITVVFLPASDDFAALAMRVGSGRARTFRDQVACEIFARDGRAFMQNACFAEADSLE